MLSGQGIATDQAKASRQSLSAVESKARLNLIATAK